MTAGRDRGLTAVSDRDWEARIAAAIEAVDPGRLPVVVELSGMPKVGKSMFADAITDLFRTAGCRVAESPDAKVEFPVRDRWRFDFSAWAVVAFVKRFLELKESGHQVIVADRGLFDAMAWLRLKAELGRCDQGTLSHLRALAYSRPWWHQHFLVLLFLSSAEDVLARASERRLYEGASPVTTRANIEPLRRALQAEAALCNREGRLVKEFDVSGISAAEVLRAGAEEVVSSLEQHARVE